MTQLKGIIDYTNKEFVAVGKVSVSRHKDGSLRVIGGRGPNLKITGDIPINIRYCTVETLSDGTVQVVSTKPMPSYAELRSVINREVSLEVAKAIVDSEYIVLENDDEVGLEWGYLIAVATHLYKKEEPFVQEISLMTSMQKFQIWWHYYMKMLILKNDIHIVDKLPDSKRTIFGEKAPIENLRFEPIKLLNHGKPYLDMRTVAIFKLHESLHIKTYEQFISPENIEHTDMGDNWKQNGYAFRYRVEYYGIYDWYPKFRNEIQIINP